MTLDAISGLTDDDLLALEKLVSREQRRRRRKARRERKQTFIRSAPTPTVPYLPGGRVRRWTLYVLLLEKHRYYVGITAQRVQSRYEQHAQGIGAKWTRQHPPLGVLESYPLGRMCESDAVKHETAKTLQVMAQYGEANVRGGSMCFLDAAKVAREAERLRKIAERSIAA